MILKKKKEFEKIRKKICGKKIKKKKNRKKKNNFVLKKKI